MSRDPSDEPTPRDPRALLSAAGLLSAVAVVFVLGAVLHGRVPEPAEEPTDLPTDLAAAPPAAAPATDGSVAVRSATDRARLASRRQRWTLQLLVACREEGVERLLAQAGDEEELYVLPWTVGGRACWAVTWGTFPSQADALASSPPPALRLSEPARPKPVSDYLP